MEDLRKLRNKNILSHFIREGIFTHEECRKIIDCKDTRPVQDAVIYKSGDNRVEKSVRNTRVKVINRTPDTLWIGDKLHRHVWSANRLFFNFNISYIADLQLLEYREDCFYDWHIDILPGADTETRKISIIVFLSDPKDYEGGLVNLHLKNQHDTFTQGSVLIFPSFHPHKVEPVTKGIRHSLVAWAYGDPFI